MKGIRLQPGRPLLPASARHGAGGLLIGCAILVAALGVLFAHQTTADGFDSAADAPLISGLGGHHNLALWLAAPGSLIPAGVLSAAVVVACLLGGRLNGAVLAAVTVPVAIGLDEGLLKPLFHRTYLGSLSYPSGHTTATVSLATVITVLLLVSPQAVRPGPLSVLISVAAYLLAAVVALAVIALRWHYFTDTVGGAAVAVGTVCGLALLLELPTARRWLTRASRQRAEPLAGRTSPAARRR